jgi:EAL domain-containing protein (putative c-di-GMP-specific phosphodiesterase class I)
MYRAKASGKGHVEVFEPEMRSLVVERLELKAELEHAVAQGQLDLDYQPIVRLDTEEVVGLEALLRWRHPVRGTLGPDTFIALAEESGLILPIGLQVLHAATRQAAAWHRSLGRPLGISVNLSARQLSDDSFGESVAEILAETGLPASFLTLELTETMLMAEPEAAAARLTALRALGVRIAIDDFGTGYSSLGYLRRFPVDVLKVAKPFLDEIGQRDGARIVTAVVRLSTALGLDAVAEGIETPEQRERLRHIGCPFGQGYLFAAPAAPEAVEARLRARADAA